MLVQALVKAGHEVAGMDNGLFEECVFGRDTVDVPETKMDIRDAERSHLEGFDAVVHLAGLCNDPLSDLNPELTIEINYRASVRLAALAREAGVKRFVLSSSCSLYGASDGNFADETAEPRPITVYGRSKLLAERDIAALASDSFSPVFLRNATVYGTSARLRLDLVLNDFAGAAFTTGRIYVRSDGTPWRPMVHVQDVGSAFLKVLEAPRDAVHKEVFNVGANEENYRVRELAEFVKDAVPGSRIEYAPDGGPDRRCYRVDCTKIRRAISFQAQSSAREGSTELYRSFSELRLNKADYEGPRYRRLQRIKELIQHGVLNSDLRWTERRAAGGEKVRSAGLAPPL